MSVWGGGSFENDEALDWVDTLIASPTAQTVLLETLQAVTLSADRPQSSDAMDSGTAQQAIAAAETVALLHGNGGIDVPDALELWTAGRHESIGADMVRLAVAAVTRITAASELRDLWYEEDPDALTEWQDAVDDLLARLHDSLQAT